MAAANDVSRPCNRSVVTILSIDGGGVRGIIPATALAFLEAELQRLDGVPGCQPPSIADYFDVVAGTRAGGLLAAMLTAPNKEGRPMYTASDIVDFYVKHCPRIFPPKRGLFCMTRRMLGLLRGPRYDGKYLRRLVAEELHQTRLSQILTDVVIPTFDIMKLQPTIFSTHDARDNDLKDPLLSDVCTATSARPTYLPAHHFEISKAEYNLIDGGIAVNNPTLVALCHVMKKLRTQDHDLFQPNSTQFRILSLGTGSSRRKGRYSAEIASKWGTLEWLIGLGTTPVISFFMEASSDMVDIHASALFKILHCEESYLRIQEHGLSGDAASTDLSTNNNLEALKNIGKELLEKEVTRVNLDTGEYETVGGVGGNTNKEALAHFAKLLSEEKQQQNMLKNPDS